MLKPPSTFKNYTLIYSGDPGLRLPADEKERARVLEVARETGNWHELIGDEQPTVFTLRPLKGTELDWWSGESKFCPRLNRPLSEFESLALLLRLALVSVENFGPHQVKPVQNKATGTMMADQSIIDALYGDEGTEGRKVVIELGRIVDERAWTARNPKS